jgi:hypothetical protein
MPWYNVILLPEVIKWLWSGGIGGGHIFDGSISCYVHVVHITMCTVLHSIVPITRRGTVVVVIVWKLDLQLPMQSVPITTKVVISNSVHNMKTHKKPPVNWGTLQNTTQKTKYWATWKPTKNLQWTEVLYKTLHRKLKIEQHENPLLITLKIVYHK